MPPPRGPFKKTAIDHVAEALMHLEAAEVALARVDDGKVSALARAAINDMRSAVTDGQRASADSIEALLGGGLRVQRDGNSGPPAAIVAKAAARAPRPARVATPEVKSPVKRPARKKV